jgi:hypothetical protein
MGKFNQMVVEMSENASYVSDEVFLGTSKSEVTVLSTLYVDSKKEYIYAVDDKNIIRKMKIDKDDKTEARIVFAKAKSLINKPVIFLTRDTIDRFGNIRKWKNSNWFCDIIGVE